MTVLSPIQDTCRRRQGIQVDTTCNRATCIRCKRGITSPMNECFVRLSSHSPVMSSARCCPVAGRPSWQVRLHHILSRRSAAIKSQEDLWRVGVHAISQTVNQMTASRAVECFTEEIKPGFHYPSSRPWVHGPWTRVHFLTPELTARVDGC